MKKSSILVAFDPSGKNAILKKQIESLSHELDSKYWIFENHDSPKNLLSMAEKACVEGYETLYVLTEEGKISDVEDFLYEQALFYDVHAIPEVSIRYEASSSTPKSLRLLEVGPQPVTPAPVQTSSTLLVLGIMHLNPMVKGHAALINEILQKDVTTAVVQYLPKFSTTWDKTKVIKQIYLRAPESPTHAPLPADLREALLLGGGNITGLYGKDGVSANVPNLQRGHLLKGDSSTPIFSAIQQKFSLDKISNILVYTPKSQLQEVAAMFEAQKEYNLMDGAIIRILPLDSQDVDEPSDSLVSSANSIAEESAWDEKKTSNISAVAQTLTDKDYFTCGLITALHGVKSGKILINEVMSNKTTILSKGLGYFASIWNAIPEGDRALLNDVAKNTGIGDLLSVGKSFLNLGKAAVGLAGKKETKVDEKTMENLTKLRQGFAKMGYDLLTMINHRDYKAFKAKLDL